MAQRTFHFTEGSSAKFWTIEQQGSSYTVTYGRLGTAGQTQTKDLPSEAEAQQASQKLIAEKLRKGYQEVTDGAPAQQPAAPKPQRAAKPQQPAPAPEPAAPPAPSVQDLDQRSIDLEPQDWMWATWRPRQPLTRPQPKPFKREEALKRLTKLRVTTYGWDWDWSTARIDVSLTSEEASFWLMAMLRGNRDTTPKRLADELAQAQPVPPPPLQALAAALEAMNYHFVQREIVLPLSNLYSLSDLMALLELLNERVLASYYPASYVGNTLVSGMASFVLPYLENAEISALRNAISSKITVRHWSPNTSGSASLFFYLAAALGAHQELRALVESWPDELFSSATMNSYNQRPQQLIFGLGDPQLVEHHMRRLKLFLPIANRYQLPAPNYIYAWLAHTEHGALDVIRDTVLMAQNKEEAEALLSNFSVVNAPEAAPYMLELMLKSKAPAPARRWLDEHLPQTIAGLIPVAAGKGELARAAADVLLRHARAGHRALIDAALERHPDAVSSAVRAAVLEDATQQLPAFDDQTTPAWLRAGLAQLPPKAKRPSWVRSTDLTPIIVSEGRLSEAQIDQVLQALSLSTFAQPHPLLADLKAHADRRVLDQFVWQLFELWLAEGAPSKEKWAMAALGLLGSDAIALRLSPLVRVWPGESQHQRAVFGLECLRAIGSDTALMQLNGIAQKVKFTGLRDRAKVLMGEIAEQRGLTRAQLEDRVVPDCDLDERGTRTFDYGARQFRFVLGGDLKPMLRDEAGKLHSALPKPRATDDQQRAAEAADEWKLLKKQIGEVVKIQAPRLEQAMVTGRLWSGQEFEQLLAQHPLMRHLVRMLIWGVYTPAGALQGTFRVTEDGTYADSADEAYALPEGVLVGIVHPLQLDQATQATWGELLSDYEIVQPFLQLGRTTHALLPEERDATEILRFKETALPASTLVFTLEKLGWLRGMPLDGGVFQEHTKAFAGADVTAVVTYDGVPVGIIGEWEDQKIESCYFVAGYHDKAVWYRKDQQLPLSAIDPIVISEVLRDLTMIAAKGN